MRGKTRLFASLVENKRIAGKVRQRTVAWLGEVQADQVPFLKAAYTNPEDRPHLVWDGKTGQEPEPPR